MNNNKTFGNTPFNAELDIQKINKMMEKGHIFPETIEGIADLRNVEVIANVLWRMKQTLENDATESVNESEPT